MANCVRKCLTTQLVKNSAALFVQRCGFSTLITADEPILTEVNSKSGIAVMKWNRKPVNSLNLHFLEKFTETLKSTEENPDIQALILTSNIPNIFCAGLDFKEIHRPDKKRLELFSATFRNAWIALYGSRLATIAAINGFSPAGGCLVTLACDYRIMNQSKNSKPAIGLSEVLLGIVVQQWVSELLCNSIGRRQAELALTLGKLFTAEEALAVGLVDEVASDDRDLMSKAKQQAEKYVKIPGVFRHSIKMKLRKPMIDTILNMQKNMPDELVLCLTNEEVQKTLDAYVTNLKNKN